MPRWLSKPAKVEWKLIISEWQTAGVLRQIDGPILATYCEAYVQVRAAAIHLHKHGALLQTWTILGGKRVSTGWKKSPASTILKEQGMLLRSLGSELGLSPASRERLTSGGRLAGGGASGELADFFESQPKDEPPGDPTIH